MHITEFTCFSEIRINMVINWPIIGSSVIPHLVLFIRIWLDFYDYFNCCFRLLGYSIGLQLCLSGNKILLEIISIIYIKNHDEKLTHASINAFVLLFCFSDLQCSFSCYKSISRKHIFFPSIDMLTPPSFSSNPLASFANRNPLVSLDPKNARSRRQRIISEFIFRLTSTKYK